MSNEQVKKKYIDEANDLINELEDILLEIDNNPDDKSLVERVFRVMHSLKGSGAMFGYEKISEITHELESIYDNIRSDKITISRQLLDITFASVDHIRNLLLDELSEEIKLQHEKIKNQITGFLDDSEIRDNNDLQNNITKTDIGSELSTWYIFFKPDEDIMKSGNNPLYLVDELSFLGESMIIVRTGHIPPLDSFDTDLCYLEWEIFLVTAADIEDIKEVFMFVEDICTIKIEKLADTNLFSLKPFISVIARYKTEQASISTEAIKSLIADRLMSLQDTGIPSKESNEKKTKKSKELKLASIRVASHKLENLMNLVSELVTTQARLSLFAKEQNNSNLKQIAEDVQKLSRHLRDNALDICLIPLDNIINRFRRLVRDLSAELHKDIILHTEGMDAELDINIIEQLIDPLMHIIRNSIDHGIETPEIRRQKGKPAQGNISIKAFYSGTNLVIIITDDGAGINPTNVRETALTKGLINKDADISDKDIINFVFEHGFSTAKQISGTSGRGVGMDVVRQKIEEIRGEVSIDSKPGIETSITIKLPLTLSIIDGLLVKIHKTSFLIPLSVVEQIAAVSNQQVETSFNNLLIINQQQLSFCNLRKEFDITDDIPKYYEIVIVNYDNQHVGLLFDKVIGEYQAVLKPLGKHYKKQDIFSGATILGNGTVALVIDTNKTIKKFTETL